MSILSHRDEFLDLYKHTKHEKFESSTPTKEVDILGITYRSNCKERRYGQKSDRP